MPAILGYKLPAANVGKVDNRGIDLNITHRNHLRDFNYSIAGNLTWARNKVIDLLEPAGEKNNPRQRSTGHSMSQYFGYEALGLFQSDEEANNWPQPQFGKAKAGDIKYKDQNGDGIIDAEDEIAIGRSNYPELVYGLNLNAEWKGFDITFFFQEQHWQTSITMVTWPSHTSKDAEEPCSNITSATRGRPKIRKLNFHACTMEAMPITNCSLLSGCVTVHTSV